MARKKFMLLSSIAFIALVFIAGASIAIVVIALIVILTGGFDD
jgi:hypothetical protein